MSRSFKKTVNLIGFLAALLVTDFEQTSRASTVTLDLSISGDLIPINEGSITPIFADSIDLSVVLDVNPVDNLPTTVGLSSFTVNSGSSSGTIGADAADFSSPTGFLTLNNSVTGSPIIGFPDTLTGFGGSLLTSPRDGFSFVLGTSDTTFAGQPLSSFIFSAVDATDTTFENVPGLELNDLVDGATFGFFSIELSFFFPDGSFGSFNGLIENPEISLNGRSIVSTDSFLPVPLPTTAPLLLGGLAFLGLLTWRRKGRA